MIPGICAATVLIIFMIILYILYSVAFAYPKRKRINPYKIPADATYEPLIDKMEAVVKQMDEVAFNEVSIQNSKNKILQGRLYRGEEKAPVVLFFHGYHGTYMWDGYGCYLYCIKHGYNLLMVEQRAHGHNSYNTITFGIRESEDCDRWIEFAKNIFPDNDMILWGVSMGAATVMMASEHYSCEEIKAVIEESGYTTPKAIIQKTLEYMKLSPKMVYPFVKLSAIIFGHTNIDKNSPIKTLADSDIPVLFMHGAEDGFVPPSMCDELHDACKSDKGKIFIPKAKHAVCAMTNYELYEESIENFLQKKAEKTFS